MASKLTATIDRFEGTLAILTLGDGQYFTVAREFLPPGSAEGSIVKVSFASDQEDEAARADRARQLLTDILRGRE